MIVNDDVTHSLVLSANKVANPTYCTQKSGSPTRADPLSYLILRLFFKFALFGRKNRLSAVKIKGIPDLIIIRQNQCPRPLRCISQP